MTESKPHPGWWLPADWPAPREVHAGITTRGPGPHTGPLSGMNLALHVGDDPARVEINRSSLRAGLALARPPCWLEQVHGTRILRADAPGMDLRADGSWTPLPGVACVVMVADCVPVLVCNRAGTRVSALHAGWRGLAGGVIAAGISALGGADAGLMAWIGPCIGPQAYEVDANVRTACLDRDPGAGDAFTPTRAGHWRADLGLLARRQLAAAGIQEIHASARCVHAEPATFYSHRRDGASGRMAALIWRDALDTAASRG